MNEPATRRRATPVDVGVALACLVAVFWLRPVVVLAAVGGGVTIALASWVARTALGEHVEGDGNVGLTGFLVLYAVGLAILGVYLIAHTMATHGA